jgi:hypothetical protein
MTDKGNWVPTFVGMTVMIRFAIMIRVAIHQTLVMPLKNGTQKVLKLGPDFRRDDE